MNEPSIEWQVEVGDQGETFIATDQETVRKLLGEWSAKIIAAWNPLRSQQFTLRIRRVVRAPVSVRAPSEPIVHDAPLDRT